jgi:hypothetical protein
MALAENPLPAATYNAFTSISAVHHMSLPAVLPRLAAALKPGGLLAAVAFSRSQLSARPARQLRPGHLRWDRTGSFSPKYPSVQAVDISFEKWTSFMSPYKRVGSRRILRPALRLPGLMQGVSPVCRRSFLIDLSFSSTAPRSDRRHLAAGDRTQKPGLMAEMQD